MPFNANMIKKGPSVDEARLKSQDGKVKVENVLSFGENKNQLSVEEARAAMQAAGEAPAGNAREARPGRTANTSDDTKTRWQKAEKTATPSTVVRVETPATRPAQPTQPQAGEPQYLIRFTYPDGKEEIIEAANRVHMIREVKRRQAWLMAKGLKATVEVAEIGADGEAAEAVSTEVGAGVSGGKVSADGSKVESEPAQRGQGGSSPVQQQAQQTERVENSKFVLDIFQEDGEWVGQITYKNGSGTERFSADSRKALLMKVLEGKAHATLKVREVLRRDQYHDDLDKVYDIPGYSQDAFEALTSEAQALVIDSIAAKSAIEFIQGTPEFFGNKNNKDMLLTFLHKRNLPITVKNLKYAFGELFDDLDARPTQKVSVPETPAPAVATVAADSAPTTAAAPVVASAAPTPAAAPTTEVRKRGSFGFKPGFTSLAPSEFEESTEGGKKTTEPSEKEARSIPLEELAKQVRSKYNRNRQF